MVLSTESDGSVSETLGQRIRKRRNEKGWSLPHLSAEAAVSKGYLWGLENDRAPKPSASTLFRIASVLGTSVADLLGEGLQIQKDLDVPGSLRRFAEREGLTEEDVRMLAGIHYRGKRPQTEDDWKYLFGSIQRSVPRRRASHALKHARNRSTWSSRESQTLANAVGTTDPVKAIRATARDLLASGELTSPPTDLPLLASIQNILRIESLNMKEAGRLVPMGRGLVVQVNALDTGRRRNFTIAHEIAHTLLPGYSRNPVFRSDTAVGTFARNDEEEYLCDIGASALLLPEEWLRPRAAHLGVSLDAIFSLAEEFEASLEATALAWIQLEIWPCAVVVWEKAFKPAEFKLLNQTPLPGLEEYRPEPKFRVAKFFRSQKFPWFIPRFKSVPDESIVAGAAGFGFASGTLEIELRGTILRFECEARAAHYRREGVEVPRVVSVIRSLADVLP